MKWTPAAQAAVSKVPFFVRKKVKSRVESEAAARGKGRISLADVRATQARFLANMGNEVKGYQVDTCFGSGGCPHRANPDDTLGDTLLERIETRLQKEDLLGFLQQRVAGSLKFHHEFRVTLADCPNACSQPQIKDIGIIGAVSPGITDEPCSLCGDCVHACRESSLSLDQETATPEINFNTCLACGKCIQACPTGTLVAEKTGFRVQLGGKLGRHPRLARELEGLFSAADVLRILTWCLDFYKRNSRRGERFAELFQDADFENMANGLRR